MAIVPDSTSAPSSAGPQDSRAPGRTVSAFARDPLNTFRTVFPKQLPEAATRVLHLHQQLSKFERFSPQRQDRLLGGQLNHLLQHAKRYAPFWAQRRLLLDDASDAVLE